MTISKGILAAHRSKNLALKLSRALCETPVAAPDQNESEPQFTRRVLVPIVREELARLPGLALQLRGDGGDQQAVPSFVLGAVFFPDLAVSIGSQHLWAAEVKFLRPTGRQNALATAIGQAVVYQQRYEFVSLIVVDFSTVDCDHRADFVRFARDGAQLDVVVASVVGRSRIQFFGS